MLDTDRLSYFSKCMFCSEKYAHLYRLLFGKFSLNHLTICRTPNFVVLPDIAPLVEGHLLIVSLTHFLCFGNLLDKHFKEFTELKDYITQLLTKTYTRPIFFEHGPALPKRAGCCINHAHIHCVPSETDLSSSISNKLIKERISSILDLCGYSEREISYLFYETSPSRLYVYALDDELSILPSQYLRMVLAANLRLDKWDWREMISDKNYKNENKRKILKAIAKLKQNTFSSVLY